VQFEKLHAKLTSKALHDLFKFTMIDSSDFMMRLTMLPKTADRQVTPICPNQHKKSGRIRPTRNP